MRKTFVLNNASHEQLLNVFNYIKTSKDCVIIMKRISHIQGIKECNYWKSIGLILSDGDFSLLLKKGNKISFRGLTERTAYSILKSFLEPSLPLYLKIGIMKNAGDEYYYISIPFRKNPYLMSIKDCIEKIVGNPKLTLNRLNNEMLASLFSGIIDGDGYIGKSGKYLSISYNKNTIKGSIIDTLLAILSNRGLIRRNKYVGKPRYEEFIRFTDLDFLASCLKHVYHPIRKMRLYRYYINWLKNYQCNFTKDQLITIISNAESAYISRRSSRQSKVLVIYINAEKFRHINHIWINNHHDLKPKPIFNKGKVMVKIAEKCIPELKNIIADMLKRHRPKINRRVVSTIEDFCS